MPPISRATCRRNSTPEAQRNDRAGLQGAGKRWPLAATRARRGPNRTCALRHRLGQDARPVLSLLSRRVPVCSRPVVGLGRPLDAAASYWRTLGHRDSPSSAISHELAASCRHSLYPDRYRDEVSVFRLAHRAFIRRRSALRVPTQLSHCEQVHYARRHLFRHLDAPGVRFQSLVERAGYESRVPWSSAPSENGRRPRDNSLCVRHDIFRDRLGDVAISPLGLDDLRFSRLHLAAYFLHVSDDRGGRPALENRADGRSHPGAPPARPCQTPPLLRHVVGLLWFLPAFNHLVRQPAGRDYLLS